MNNRTLRQMAFYGKGGIGKSTTVSNISAYCALNGMNVLQIGCDPKHDSSRPFLDGREPVTIIDLLRAQNGHNPDVNQYLMDSSIGVKYIEVGGPEPGVGCAGRGILKMFELLEKSSVLNSSFEYILYDVLGDVVCGGFAAPLRAGYAKEVYIVISGEYMALYAANNICRGIVNYAKRRHVRLGGLIVNSRNVPREAAVAEAFAQRINSQIIGLMPRDNIVSIAEVKGKTVIELFPDSPQGIAYAELAQTIINNTDLTIPEPFTDKELQELYYSMVYDDEYRSKSL